MTEAQAQQMIDLLERIAATSDKTLEAIQTLAAGLNTNLNTLSTTVDEIEQGVGQLVSASNPEATT